MTPSVSLSEDKLVAASVNAREALFAAWLCFYCPCAPGGVNLTAILRRFLALFRTFGRAIGAWRFHDDSATVS